MSYMQQTYQKKTHPTTQSNLKKFNAPIKKIGVNEMSGGRGVKSVICNLILLSFIHFPIRFVLFNSSAVMIRSFV